MLLPTISTRTLLILVASALATTLLGVVPGPALLLIAGSVLAGVSRGIFTLVQATAITDRWGAVHYGQLNGLLIAPVMLTAAVAPAGGQRVGGLARWLSGGGRRSRAGRGRGGHVVDR